MRLAPLSGRELRGWRDACGQTLERTSRNVFSIYGAVGRFSITDFGNAAVRAQKSTPKPDHFLVAFDRQSAVTGERQ
jgi:hypothetical protein